MDDDDGLMLNFAPAAAPPSKRPKQTAKARFAQKRTAQQQRRQAVNGISENSVVATAYASRPAQASSRSATSTDSTRAKTRPAASSTGLAAPRFDPRSVSSASSAQPKASTAARPGSSAPKSSRNSGKVSALFPSHGVLEQSDSAPIPSSRPVYDPTNAPSAGSDFSSCGLDPLLVYHLESKMKVGSHPTPIQRAALPHLLHQGLDRDILIQAQTGSGKTLTYLLPIVQSLLPLCQESFIDRSVGTLAIILAPTRELARQIYQVLEKLVSLALSLKEQSQGGDGAVRRTRWLVPGLLSGGSTKNHEKQRLRKGCPILVSTPGRLLDHLQNTSSFDVGKCRWLVLDEADRLLEMGFEEQLGGIVRALDGRRNLACTAARQAMPGYEQGTAPGHLDWIPDHDVVDTLGITWWTHPRRVVLCSATLDENVQVLSGKTLVNPKIIRGIKDDTLETKQDASASPHATTANEPSSGPNKFAAPAQLAQSFVATPPKLRLVTLLSLLRAYISRARRLSEQADLSIQAGAGRVIVFISCTDSVDFHYAALGGAKMMAEENDPNASEEAEDDKFAAHATSELIPGIPIFRLHGSMSQQERIASLKGFSGTATKKQAQNITQQGGFQGSILLCTSVASRGLDLPDVGCVVQLDPPTEGGVEEYLHRVGRTARVGRPGESWLMVLPQELGWIDNVLEPHMTIQGPTSNDALIESKNKGYARKISSASIELILQQGFGGTSGTLEYQSRATEVQLAFERWVISGERPSLLARKAFLSHVRAYATHSAEEKQYFNVRALHLGHLAKAFALREAPRSLGAISSAIAATSTAIAAKEAKTSIKRKADFESSDFHSDSEEEDGGSDYKSSRKKQKGDAFELSKDALTKLTESIIANVDGSNRSKKLAKEAARAAAAAGVAGEKAKQTDAESRMYAKVRALGKMSKKHGVLGAHGADEFQIA